MSNDRQIAIRAIEEFCRITNLSASALATKSKVAPSTLNRKLRGTDPTEISRTTLNKLAKTAGFTSYEDYITKKTNVDRKELALPEPIIAIIDMIKRILFLQIRRSNIDRDEVALLFSNLKKDYEGFTPPQLESADVVSQILTFVNGLSLEGEPLKVEQQLAHAQDQ